MLKSELEYFKTLNISEYKDAVDITSINISNNISQEEKADEFLSNIHNPYIFKVNDVTVKVNFSGDKSFSEVFAKAVKNI